MRIEGCSIPYIRNTMGLKSDAQVIRWTKKYLEIGETAFDIELRGKKSGAGKGRPKTNFSSLEEENKYLRMENEYLKKLRALQKKNIKINKYEIIYQMKKSYSISHLCKTARLQRSGYYSWLNRQNKISINGQINTQVSELILKAYKESKGTYGIERLYLYVNKNMSIPINRKRIQRLKSILGLKSIIRKKFHYRKYNPAKICSNTLNREFQAKKPLEKLCMDTTYIPVNNCNSRFIYMNAVKDLYNGEIIAYDLSLKNDVSLVNSTLSKLFKLPIEKGCIIHTDQGSTYSRVAYCEELKEKNFNVSMSRRGNCWDNAPIESFFSHFKSESIYITETKEFESLISEIHEYIHFYNNKRIQKKLNGLSPVEYRTKTA